MTARERAFAAIDSCADEMCELQSLLTAIPAMAPESGGDGEMKKAEALVAWLRKNGVSGIERHDAPDPRVPGGLRPNVVATLRGRSPGRRLWIMSHLDVVPEGDRAMWKSDPFKAEVRDGRVYGRGSEDNHQGIVSSVFAALALARNGIVPAHDVKLLFVADEEVGSDYGIQFLLRERSLFAPDDLVVIPDGGAPDGSEIEVAEKNILWLKIVTKGRQCHASVPDDGRNAFLAACDLALRINRLEREAFPARNPLFNPDRTTLCPTKKEPNVPNVNTIPGDDAFYVDCRILPEYQNDAVLSKIREAATDVGRLHGVGITVEVDQRLESRPTPVDSPVVTALTAAVREVYSVKARPVGIGGGTVGAYLRNAGYDCVVWSRLEETAHQPNECASLENMMGDAKVMAMLMIRE